MLLHIVGVYDSYKYVIKVCICETQTVDCIIIISNKLQFLHSEELATFNTRYTSRCTEVNNYYASKYEVVILLIQLG